VPSLGTRTVERKLTAIFAADVEGYSRLMGIDEVGTLQTRHVSPRDMRTHPIGTGPFKFAEFKPNERITVTRNPDLSACSGICVCGPTYACSA
jgi:ABC-type transport system substrate-binding protein